MNGRISPRALSTALRTRAEAVVLASERLAASLAAADEAAQAEHAAIVAICREADMASSLEADDLAVEAFAAWLPIGRQAVAASRAGRDAAEASVVVARAGLAAARSAEAATEALLAEQAELRRKAQLHVEQTALDEAASRSGSHPAHRPRNRPE